MLNNCPASQHKSLRGLDVAAVDGSVSFDLLLKIIIELKNNHRDTLLTGIYPSILTNVCFVEEG